MKKTLVFTLFLPFLSSLWSDPGESGPVAETDTVSGTEAVPLEKVRPIYPRSALRKGVEGWVVTAFVVNSDGTTSDISIVDSSIEGYFEEAAIEATAKSRYEPATWNGIAVTQAKNTNRYVFAIKDIGSGSSKTFGKRYREANAALEAEDLDRVKKIIDQLDEMESRTFKDAFLLDMIKGNYYRARQDYPQALIFYQRSLYAAKDVVTDEWYADILRVTISLAAYLNEFSIALHYFEVLQSISPNMPPDDPARKTIQKIRGFVGGDEPMEFIGKIKQPCAVCETLVPYWSRTLLRDTFSIDQVNGNIDELKLMCGFKFVSLEYFPDTKWSVNQDWGSCDLYVLGTEGTTFRLVAY